MTDSAPSPKRRHVLSSLNPETPSSYTTTRLSGDVNAANNNNNNNDNDNDNDKNDDDAMDRSRRNSSPRPAMSPPVENTWQPRRSRLKLKTNRERRQEQSQKPSNTSTSSGRREHQDSEERRRRRRQRRHRHHRSPTPISHDDPPVLDPEAAFRESLFDAMADDEGAMYWESIYGQPVHVYPNQKVGADGTLEQMTDDEYAAHVRQKMWEKTHAGLLEERARRELRRQREEQEERERRRIHEVMEQSLRRGQQRRQRRQWTQEWDEYTRAWSSWDGKAETLAWPVQGRERRAMGGGGGGGGEEVRAFYIHGLDLERVGQRAFAARLKEERVRWHPDKMQQRLGGTVDGGILRDVTAVFQAIDQLWTDMRPQA